MSTESHQEERKLWMRRYKGAIGDLTRLRDVIDDLGDDGQTLEKAEEGRRGADEIACYASNSIEGTLALMRELFGRVCGEELSEETTEPNRRELKQ